MATEKDVDFFLFTPYNMGLFQGGALIFMSPIHEFYHRKALFFEKPDLAKQIVKATTHKEIRLLAAVISVKTVKDSQWEQALAFMDAACRNCMMYNEMAKRILIETGQKKLLYWDMEYPDNYAGLSKNTFKT